MNDTKPEIEKLCFALDVEDDWPPVATESVWCKRSLNAYHLQNAPFFIRGIAYGDKFVAELDPINGCIFEFQITESSGHSLLWVLNNDDLDFEDAKQRLLALGCSIEGFPAFRLHSIDVPPAVDFVAINAVVDGLEELGFQLAFAVWRHDVNEA